MLFSRWKLRKNKKGVTLVEMIAAIAITAILASVLSMMIVPVMNSYRNASTKAELQEAVTARLNDIAMHLRGAKGVYMSTYKKSFPDINKGTYQYDGVREYEAKFGFALASDGMSGASSSYLYPELKWADYSNVNKPSLKWASDYTPNLKLPSDDFKTTDYWCASSEDFFFYVRNNPDGGNHSNALEVHLKVKKGSVVYEGTKTIVCENLMINGKDIYLAKFEKDNDTGKWKDLTKATVSTGSDSTQWTKYYSVWFARDI